MRLLVAFALVGCVRGSSGYQCKTSDDCSGGTCQSTGFCSFADGSCASGQRYGMYSGSLANQCVGDVPMIDAAVDSRSDTPTPIDALVAPILVGSAHSNNGGQATLTYSMIVPPGNRRYLIVSVQLANDCGGGVPATSSVMYGATALTLLDKIDGVPCSMATRSELWKLVAPPVGTQDVVITLATATPFTIHSGAFAFTGVNQTTPVRNVAKTSAEGTSTTVTVTSALFDLVLDVVGTGGAFNAPGLGQTVVFTNNNSGGNTLDNSAASTKDGVAGDVSFSWTGANDDWQELAVSIQP